MVDPESPGADDVDYPEKWFEEVLARCERDPALNVLKELRRGAKNPALLDDMERRQEELYATMSEALSTVGSYEATPETGVAITAYHQRVVIPLMVKLVHQLLAVQAELALHKAQLTERAR